MKLLIFNKKNKLMLVLLHVLFFIGCGNNAVDIPSHSLLQGYYIFFCPEVYAEYDVPTLLGVANVNVPQIVSAEEVFTKVVLKKFGDRPDWSLVAENYRNSIKPKYPEGKTILERWGSSFFTWSMTAEKWNWAVEFELNREDSGSTRSLRGFPVLWDKRPDLQKGKACVLYMGQLGADVTVLEDEEFQICLGYVKKWLELCDKDVPEILKLLEAGDVHEKRFAIRVLGIRKASETLPVLIEKMNDPSLIRYVLGALARIKDEKAVPSLVKAFYAPDFDSGTVVITMCRIGGEQVHRELKDWLNDPGMSSGRKSSIMYGIWRADYKPGKELIEPFLKSDDKDLKKAAEQAMRNLEEK